MGKHSAAQQLAATENAAKQQKQEAEKLLIATKNAAQQQLAATKNAAQQQLNLLQRQLYEQKAIHHSADKLEEEVATVCKQAKVSATLPPVGLSNKGQVVP